MNNSVDQLGLLPGPVTRGQSGPRHWSERDSIHQDLVQDVGWQSPRWRGGPHSIAGYGLEIVAQLPIEVAPNKHNLAYLRTKRDKVGHRFPETNDLIGDA